MLFLNTSTQAHWQKWIPWWWLRILHFRYLRTPISIQNQFISASAISWWHRIITVIIIHRPDYTAEFLPIISPLRICTPLPSNSTDEFIFPPTSGNVFNGCFSSSLWCAWAARFIERWKQENKFILERQEKNETCYLLTIKLVLWWQNETI